MHLVNDFRTFETITKARAREVYDRTGRVSQLVGIIFSPVQNRVVEEIAQSLGYWHARSGDHFDLYWAGYSFWGEGIRNGSANKLIANSMVTAHQLDPYYIFNQNIPPVGIDYPAFTKFVDDLNTKLYIAHNKGRHPLAAMNSDNHLYYPGGTELFSSMLIMIQHARPTQPVLSTVNQHGSTCLDFQMSNRDRIYSGFSRTFTRTPPAPSAIHMYDTG